MSARRAGTPEGPCGSLCGLRTNGAPECIDTGGGTTLTTHAKRTDANQAEICRALHQGTFKKLTSPKARALRLG
jgi:hypothetical protein